MRASHKLDKGNRRYMLNFIAIKFRLKRWYKYFRFLSETPSLKIESHFSCFREVGRGFFFFLFHLFFKLLHLLLVDVSSAWFFSWLWDILYFPWIPRDSNTIFSWESYHMQFLLPRVTKKSEKCERDIRMPWKSREKNYFSKKGGKNQHKPLLFVIAYLKNCYMDCNLL